MTLRGHARGVGEFYNANTEIKVTDQFKITNTGTGPALIVNQTGTNPTIGARTWRSRAQHVI